MKIQHRRKWIISFWRVVFIFLDILRMIASSQVTTLNYIQDIFPFLTLDHPPRDARKIDDDTHQKHLRPRITRERAHKITLIMTRPLFSHFKSTYSLYLPLNPPSTWSGTSWPCIIFSARLSDPESSCSFFWQHHKQHHGTAARLLALYFFCSLQKDLSTTETSPACNYLPQAALLVSIPILAAKTHIILSRVHCTFWKSSRLPNSLPPPGFIFS